MALLQKEQWALNYLTKNPGRWISPAEIGLEYRKSVGTHKPHHTSKNDSAYGSPICLSLVGKKLAVRNPKGQYMASVNQLQGQPTVQQPAASAQDNVKKVILGSSNQQPKPADVNEEARLAYNEANGYIRFAVLPNGLEMYKKRNAAGGWTFYGESGAIFTPLWDEMKGTKEEFLAIARECYKMGEPLIVTSIEPAGYKYQVGQLLWYFKNNLVHSARVITRDTDSGPEPLYETVHGTFEESKCFPTKEALIRSL